MKRHILFLCGFNAGRSIVAESLLNRMFSDMFVAYSAGEEPKEAVHPDALRMLAQKGHDITALKTKSWREFLTPEAPPIDLAITLCDNAHGEMCMALTDKIAVGHWDLPDPALATTAEERIAIFERVYSLLERLIAGLSDLPEDYKGRQLANAVTRMGFSIAA